MRGVVSCLSKSSEETPRNKMGDKFIWRKNSQKKLKGTDRLQLSKTVSF